MVNQAPLSIGLYDVIGLLGAIAGASTVVLIRQLTRRFTTGTIFIAQCLWIGIPILPFALPHFASLSWIDCLILSIAGSVTGMGQLLMNEGYRRLPVAAGASLQNTWPLLATIGGMVFFAERFSSIQWLGAALILVGIFCFNLTKRNQPMT